MHHCTINSNITVLIAKVEMKLKLELTQVANINEDQSETTVHVVAQQNSQQYE